MAGGTEPAPLQGIVPVAQSAVVQENLPVESVEQRVRPQKRPDQPGGAERVVEDAGVSLKPVSDNDCEVAPESVPAQTV